MNSDQVRDTLRNALDRWAEPPDEHTTGARVTADLEHISAFALATIAVELGEIRKILNVVVDYDHDAVKVRS